MLDTNAFINELIKENYTHLCVVPCSFAKNLINAAVNMNKSIEYLPCASEAVACSVAAGLKISGKNPIAIVQSSGLTNMVSCITSLLVPYEITFPIITSWRTYSEGDSEIQHMHLAKNLPNLISSCGYDHELLDQNSISTAIHQINKAQSHKTICVLKKQTFSDVKLEKIHQINLSFYIPRSKFLETLNKKYKDKEVIFIGTTGNTSREMFSFMPETMNFYMAGNMGGALSLGLGIAKSGKKVIVCGGDAEFSMHLGGITTAGRYSSEVDLTYILFDNESNKSTGGQNTYQKHIDYIGIANNSDFYSCVDTVNDIKGFEDQLENFNNRNGCKFMHVHCGYDDETPRPPLEIVRRNSFS